LFFFRQREFMIRKKKLGETKLFEGKED